MVKRDHGGYDDVIPLPLSTREPTEGSGLLSNGDNSKRVGAFDVEFEVEDDVLLNWQHTRPGCCSCLVKRLPGLCQRIPEWWMRLSQQQRNLVLSASVAVTVLSFCLAVLLAAWFGSSEGVVRYKPQYMPASKSPYCAWTDLYLPKAIHPTKYKLHIKTTLEEPYLVEGQADIYLQAAEATPCVVLHSNGMNVSSVMMLVYKGQGSHAQQQPVQIKGRVLSSNLTSQQLVLQFPEVIPQAPLVPVLQLKFSYPLIEGLDGFYKSSFIDAANETKVLASTQFESIAARKAFPCFDEPSLKAIFEVKISAPPPPIVVLSNMPLSHTHEHEESGSDGHHEAGHGDHADGAKAADGSEAQKKALTDADLIQYHFKSTPPMSTYLVAWVVGELSHNELQCELSLPPLTIPSALPSSDHWGLQQQQSSAPGDGRNVTVKVWGTSDRVQQFGHAADVACGALREMERLTKVPYALPKLDLVAIPNFAAGAMENWGLLMYKERSLLVDDTKDDQQQRYAIATTVAHETVHQWFGNLASLDDWTELWLNEGFASYFEAVAADAYQPHMGYLTNFFHDTTSPGLESDGSPASHPLTMGRPIKKLSEIDNWFDDISYSKGAAVLRMLRAWLNRDNNELTGLLSNDTAASAAVGTAAVSGASSEAASHASTSQQWAPHLLRRHRRLQAGSNDMSSSSSSNLVPQVVHHAAGTAVDASDEDPSTSSSTGSSDGSSSPPWWTTKLHYGGLLLNSAEVDASEQPTEPAAAPPAEAAEPLVVLPINAPVPVSDESGLGAPTVAAAAHTQGRTAAPGSTLSARVLGGGSDPDTDKFILGLRKYLQEFAYGNSNYTGLWKTLSEAAGEPVEDFMRVWTLRRGFPIVSVSLGDAEGGSNKRQVKLDQVPFHAPRTYMVGLPFDPSMYCNDWSDDAQDSSWWVPLPIRLPGSNNFAWHSFSNCSGSITVEIPRNSEPWVLANTGRFGFYRVNYSEPLWAALTKASTAPAAVISSVDYAGLLDDAYSLSLVRQLNVTIFMELIKSLGTRGRPELPPWSTGLGWLQRMTDVLSTAQLLGQGDEGEKWEECLSDLNLFVTSEITKPFIQHVQLPGQQEPGLTFKVSPSDPPEVRKLRPLVLEAAGFLGDAEVIDTAVDLLAEKAAGKADVVAPDVMKAVYTLAAASGRETTYQALVKMYEEATDAAEKDRVLRALARVTTPDLIRKTLDYTLSPAVRTQDVAIVLVSLAKQGGVGFNMTWEFIMDRADDILKKYGIDDVTYSLGRPLNELAKLFVDENLIERLKILANAKPQVFSPTFFEEANEARMLNHDWLRFQGTDACSWLSNAV